MDDEVEDGDRSPRLQRALCRQLEQHEVAQLDAALRLLPPVTLAGFGLIPDPRLSSWAEMCSIGRGFVSALPARGYQPTGPEFCEMVATYLGAPSPLATPLAWAGQSGALAGPRARYSLTPGALPSRLPSSRRDRALAPGACTTTR